MTPFTTTDVVSSAKTERVAAVMVPERLNVCENIAFAPLGKVVNPGVDGLPVFAKEIQLEPGRVMLFLRGLRGLFLCVDEILRVWAFEVLDFGTSHKMPDTGGDLVDYVVIVGYE